MSSKTTSNIFLKGIIQAIRLKITLFQCKPNVKSGLQLILKREFRTFAKNLGGYLIDKAERRLPGKIPVAAHRTKQSRYRKNVKSHRP